MKQKLIILIIILGTIFQILTWTSGHNWGGDFSAYIMQAISITEGNVEKFVELKEVFLYFFKQFKVLNK